MSNPFKNKAEVKIDDFLARVHLELWEEDTMHEYRANEDGSVDIVETVHSMNSDFSRTVITIGADGLIVEEGGSETAACLKKQKTKIII